MKWRYKRLQSNHDVQKAIDWINANVEYTVLDTETTGLDEWNDSIVDIQLSLGPELTVIFPAKYAYLLSRLQVRLIGHNIKFDLKMLYRSGVDLTHLQWRDTWYLGCLADENRDSHSLDSYVTEIWKDTYKEVFWSKYDRYTEAPEAEADEYACKDIHYTGLLYEHLKTDLDKQQIPQSLVQHIHNLARPLFDTELKGIRVDIPYLTQLGQKTSATITTLNNEMRTMMSAELALLEEDAWQKEKDKRKTEKGKAGVPRPVFSFDSPKQLQALLYGTLSLPPQTNPKTKQISTDEASLSELKDLHPLIPLLMDYRAHQKIMTSFIDGVLDRMRPDGRIYPTFNVTGTVTGRVSHANPNLGQVPASGGIRGMYTPDLGNVWISADYSGLEVALEAHLTQDEMLLRIVKEKLSKHDITAKALDIPRSQAKTVNFALQYWASHYKIAKILDISAEEAKEVWDNYWVTYSGPKRLKKNTDWYVDKGKPLVTAYGRQRRFQQRYRQSWDGDYRQAYNFVIQSLGADITSEAFYTIDKWLQERYYGRALFTVHDEILIEVKEEHAKESEEKLVWIMEKVGRDRGISVPLYVESSGPCSRWSD